MLDYILPQRLLKSFAVNFFVKTENPKTARLRMCARAILVYITNLFKAILINSEL